VATRSFGRQMTEPDLNLNFVGNQVALGPLRRVLVPLYARWRNDFYLQRTYDDPLQPTSLEKVTEWYEAAIASDTAIWFTIYSKDSSRPIGHTHLFEINRHHGIANFAILIGDGDYRGKGCGTETTCLMLDYAFTALGLFNVMLTVTAFNIGGIRAYERAGFKEIGRRRGADRVGGRRWDVIYMDCCAPEFTSPVLAQVLGPDERRA
jgi:RimJ/RimL family protein N-acetyltransferase